MSEVDEYGFNVAIQEKARRYLREKILLNLFELTFFTFAALFVVFSGLSQALRNYAKSYVSDPWGYIAVYCLIGYTIFWIFYLIFKFLRNYLIEHKYGVSVQTLSSWLKDQAKIYVGTLAFLLPVVELIYHSMRKTPTIWWLITWFFTCIGIALTMYILPVVIMPLFYKFEPLKDKELVERLVRLAEKAKVKVVGVYKMGAAAKTRRAIGALTGMGNTRRILLSDTLLDNYTKDEIEGVIGHELGHHVHKHIGKIIAALMIIMLISLYLVNLTLRNSLDVFGFEGIADIANLPLFGMVINLVNWVSMPVLNSFSRRLERQADEYELKLVDKPEAFISCMVKICNQNLRYANPHPLIEAFFYDHPSGRNRIKLARKFIESKKTA